MNEAQDVTLIENAIHNPSELRHFMTVTPTGATVVAEVGDHEIARSVDSVTVKEVGRAIYDPVVYFPRGAVAMSSLERIDRTTHCPLKGDTEYFDIVAGGDRWEAAAWSYVEMTLGDELKNLIAFDTSKVTVRRT